MAVLMLSLALAACAALTPRSVVPEAAIQAAAPYGIVLDGGELREWGDAIGAVEVDRLAAMRAETLRRTRARELAAGEPIREVSLLLSGGGPDGAFGAGLLNGWTARGDRPEFDAVTGISTGAIIAVFAFLGPDYDTVLREVYTTFRTEQLLRRTILAGLTGGAALTDSSGYRALIERYVDDAVVAAIAEQHRRGRLLLIGTTNLDASRPVIWNIGRIAATGHPDAGRLIHDVIQASSAIPGAFPPVLIPVVTRDGARHDEMHVDGGATQQVMLFSPAFPLRAVDAALGAPIEREAFVVINNKLRKPYAEVRPRLLPIVAHAASSLLGGAGGGDIYRIFAIAQRDGVTLHIVTIPPEFTLEATEAFDPDYMRALFDVGFEYGLAGDRWLNDPPDYARWVEQVRPARRAATR